MTRHPAPAELTPDPPRLLTGLLLVGVFLSTFVAGGLAVAMPSLGASLELGFTTAVFVQSAYVLTAAILVLPFGKVADRHGRSGYYAAGLGAFAAGSLLAGLAPSAATLIAARCLQGVGAALVAATNEAILVTLFPRERRGRAVGLNVTAVYLGVSLGPVVGGLLTDWLGWRSIFFLSAAIAAAGLLLYRRESARLPERHTADGSTSWDRAGTVLLAISIAAVAIGLSFAPVWGWASPQALALLAGGTLAGIGLVLVERRAAQPLVDGAIFNDRPTFAIATLATLTNAFAIFAIGLLVSLYLQLSQGRSPAQAGLLLLAQPVAMALLSPVFGRLADRGASSVLPAAGMATVSVSLLLLVPASRSEDAGWIVGCLFLLGTGMSMFSAPNEVNALTAVRRGALSTAASMLGTARYLGQFLSLAVLGTVAAAALGGDGARVVFMHEGGADVGASYADGFRVAALVASVVAAATAVLLASRGRIRRRPLVDSIAG